MLQDTSFAAKTNVVALLTAHLFSLHDCRSESLAYSLGRLQHVFKGMTLPFTCLAQLRSCIHLSMGFPHVDVAIPQIMGV